MTKQTITRFPPSPTSQDGSIHFGSLRTAYHNYLHAKANSGKFIMRLDDTDLSRNNEECEENLFKMMKWAKLDFDITFKQSERLNRYNEVIEKMLSLGTAKIEDGAVFLVPDQLYLESFLSWKDEISGDIKVTNEDKQIINKFVLRKSDGMPTYHFASVVDDGDYNITDIIRGSDGIANSSRQIILFKTIGYDIPKFHHVGLIFKDKKKLSKRDNCSSIQYYVDNYDVDAVCNYSMRLGWSHPDAEFDKKCPILNRENSIKYWNEGNLKSSPSNFDQAKLDFYNKKYKQLKSIGNNI